MINLVSDPIIYPVQFTVDRRVISIVDDKTSTVTFVSLGNGIIRSGHYFYDGIFITDLDYTSTSDVSFVGSGKKAIFEFLSSSAVLSSARFNVKAWVNESSFVMAGNTEILTLRQAPWNFGVTQTSFYVSTSMKQFNPVTILDIPYYPSVSVHVFFYPDYSDGKTISNIIVDPGETSTVDVINQGDHGILTILFKLTASWYYDRERTLPVSSPPASLNSEMTSQTFASRIVFVAPGKFLFSGGVSDDGLAVFDGVLTQRYVLSNSLDYGSFRFVSYDSLSETLLVGSEEEVVVDDNGYRVKSGSLSQIYFVDGQSSSSSCSCSSSSCSCSSCSCSSSSCSCSSCSCSSSSCSCSSSSSSV